MTINASIITSINAPEKVIAISTHAIALGFSISTSAAIIIETNYRPPIITSHDFLREPKIGMLSAMIP
jgi:hypothetical protein